MLQFLKNTTRLDLIKIVIGIALIIQVLISYPLWLTTARAFPLVPIIGSSTMETNGFVHWLLFITLLGASFFTVIFHKKRRFTYLLIGILLLMMLLDATRIQAWTYQYLLMLFVLGLHTFSSSSQREESKTIVKEVVKSKKTKRTKTKRGKKNTVQKTTQETITSQVKVLGNKELYPYFLLTLQLVLIFTYLWSGIQKLNIYFANDVFPWLMTSFSALEPLGEFAYLGYAVAIIEALLGVGLIFSKTRKITIWASTIFHISILIQLAGLKWNYVVWAWNIAMIAFNWILFSDKPIFKNSSNISFGLLKSIFKTNKSAVTSFSLVVILFGIMPLFNFFGKWDEQLSLKMYAGASSEALLYFNDEDLECVPTVHLKKVYEGIYSEESRIDMDDWAFDELTVPAYGGDWAYKRAGYEFCQCVEEKGLAGIEIFKVNRWNKKTDTEIVPCNKLIKLFE